MDEIALLRDLPPDGEGSADAARAAGRRKLEARFEGDSARRSTRAPRRGPLVFAGATAVAAVVTGILVLSSGPTAQPAAAGILHETAVVAAAGDAPAGIPGPGQFLYRKIKRIELQSWIPGGASMGGGVMTRPGAFKALMPTTQESWEGADGGGRHREIAGTPRFLTSEEEDRWEAAGSRLPAPFDPEYQRKYLGHQPEQSLPFREELEARRGMVDHEIVYRGHARLKGFHFPDTSKLPTDPEALRRAVESNRIEVSGFNLMNPSAKRLDPEESIAELFNILQEGYVATPQLRAAIFNALAELPGIEVDTDATDFLGRRGYAVSSANRETGGRIEYIFDPATSEILAQRDILGDPGQNRFLRGIPAGLTVSETDYLESGVVDSTHETPAGGDRGPLATAGASNSR